LLERLLGLTRIVRNLDAATTAWRESNGAFHYVTLGGELLSRHGFYTGGYLNGNGTEKRRRPFWAGRTKSPSCRGDWASCTKQWQGSAAQRRAAKRTNCIAGGLQEAQTELRAQEVAIATHEGEFNALHNSQRLLHQKIELVVYEVQSLAAQEEEGRQKRAGLSARAAECETRERERQAQVAELTSTLRVCASIATGRTPS